MKDVWIGRDYECLKTEEEIVNALGFAMEKIDWDVKHHNIHVLKIGNRKNNPKMMKGRRHV